MPTYRVRKAQQETGQARKQGPGYKLNPKENPEMSQRAGYEKDNENKSSKKTKTNRAKLDSGNDKK